MNSSLGSILIVADSSTQADKLRLLLESNGHEVSWAKGGAEALDALEKKMPSLVISDVMLPVMNGHELCRRIKQEPRTQEISVILLSALNDPEEVIQGLSSGADGFISKRYSESLLLTRVEDFLANRQLQTPDANGDIEVMFGGRKHRISADRRRIVGLLFSTFENAVEKNPELENANRELILAQQELEVKNRALQGLYERQKGIFDTVRDCLVLFDADGYVKDMNPAAFEQLELFAVDKLPVEASSLMRHFDLYSVDGEERLLDLDENPILRGLRGETIKDFETSLVNKVTGRRWYGSHTVIPSRNEDGGEVDFVVASIRDITEQKEVEQSLEQAKALAERRLNEIDRANKEMEAFSYSVSHDLRSPLHSIKGFSGLLLRFYKDVLDDKGRDLLQRIGNNVEKMNILINDLLALSRISRQDLKQENVNLSRIAREILQEFRHSEPDRQVAVEVQDGIEARGDAGLLRIILSNLLGNAWKYTAPNSSARVEFSADYSNGSMTYRVRDNGVGFDESFAAKLFEPFQRAHSEKEFKGAGVGLAIVERAVRRHNGRVWAESKPGEGSTFHFTIEE